VEPNFDDLVEAHSKEIFSYLWRMLWDTQDAEDCLQDTFMKAYRRFDHLDEDSNLRAWLYKIAGNSARSHLRKQRRVVTKELHEGEPKQTRFRTMEESLENKQVMARVQAAVEGLPFKQRSAFILRKYQELRYDEIGSIIDCKPDAARANVYQAVKKLKSQLAGDDSGLE
jgi:RNA polymerase sigma-70 factor (ECF subfamily)